MNHLLHDHTCPVMLGTLTACLTRLNSAYFVIHVSLSFLRVSSSSSLIYTKNIPTLSSSAGVSYMTYVFLLLYHVYVCAHCQFNSSRGCFACVHPTIGLAFLAPNDTNLFPLQPVPVYFPLCTLNINSCARRASNSNIIFIKLQCRLRDVGEREFTLQMYHLTVGLKLENFFVRVYQ